MNNQKPQLGPWLIEQINSGSYHGLCWLDLDKTIFRIPWKHASRQDLCEDDYSIFKGWAIVSGKFTDGPPKWKTNFRCALNTIESFILLEDNSKASSDPHKIYSITGQNPNANPRMGGALEEDDNLESSLYISPETNLRQPDFTHHTPQHCFTTFQLQEQLDECIPDFGLMNLSDSPAERMTVGPLHAANFYNLPMDGQSNLQVPLGTPAQEVLNVSPAQVVPSDQRWEAVLDPASHQMPNLAQEVAVQFPAPHLPLNPDPEVQLEAAAPVQHLPQLTSDLDITIYYRGKEVLQTTVSNTLGCRLYYDESDERFAHLQHIKFPSTEEINDHKQKKFTNRLLSNMAGGLLLEYKNGDLYGRRLGKCQVFFTRSETSENEDSQKLNRDEETKIFNLKDFLRECIEFTHQRGGVPFCSIFLCFGQQFLVGNQKKKLILVKVVPKVCTMLIEMAHQGGASSLTSENVSLQLSNTSSIENLLSLIKEIENMDVDLEYM
ncbi:interferon regulatory factor 7 isoform X2 [Heterodontus francisci]